MVKLFLTGFDLPQTIFQENDKKMRMVYSGQGLQDAVATEEYQEGLYMNFFSPSNV